MMCAMSDMYRQVREADSVSRMRVIQMQPGAFLQLKHIVIEKTQNQQYKLPRATRDKKHLKFLLSRAIK